MNRIKTEIQVFFTAVMFYTRIPCPKWVDHSAEYLNKATRYFPIIGWIVGGFSGAVYYFSFILFEPSIGIILSMITSVLLTGAFHEDGFADVCDGFGGGWTKTKILTIMKDSAIGAYGAIGIVLILLSKFFFLSYITTIMMPIEAAGIILCGHSVSRLAAASMIFSHDYVREDDSSKSKPVAKKLSISNLIPVIIFGLAPLAIFQNFWLLIIIIPIMSTKIYLGAYFKKWIGGYTGDCLGATQQVCEIIFYLSIPILWKFIW